MFLSQLHSLLFPVLNIHTKVPIQIGDAETAKYWSQCLAFLPLASITGSIH